MFRRSLGGGSLSSDRLVRELQRVRLDPVEEFSHSRYGVRPELVPLSLVRRGLHIDIDQRAYPLGTELVDVLPRDERSHRPTDHRDVSQVESFEEGAKIASVLSERVARLRLLRPPVPAEVERDRTEVLAESDQLRLEESQASKRSVREHDRWATPRSS